MKEETKHPLEEVVWGVIPTVNYKGIYITKLPSGRYSLLGRMEVELDEVDRTIDKIMEDWNKSLKR